MHEILAPCGSPEALEAALRSGADAVYLGGECFSARQNAHNFSNEELKAAVFECHKRGVKIYQAINTVIFDEQLDECLCAVEYAAQIGIDGLITQDLALTEIVKKCCPDLEIHASTQMTIHTADGVETAKKLGFSRVVLARELPLERLRELSSLDCETEAFVHGALCMSVSGQCYMSAVIGSRSANRGLCAQACRLPCSAVKGKERYDLSLKDMSYIDKINDIESAGVYSFKIEGRMKRPEYVAATVDGLKKSLDGENYDRQLLEDVFSRNGFTDGYLTGNLGRNMFGVRTAESAAMATKAFPKIHEIYRHDEKRDRVFFDLEIKADKPVKLTATDSHGNTAEVFGDIPQAAKSKAADSQIAEKQLSKTGDTIYSFGGLDCQIDEGLFVSPSQLNGLRREVCHRLDCARAESFTKKVDFHREKLTDFQTVPQTGNQKLRISVTSLSQLAETDLSDIELCAVPLEIFSQAAKLYPVEKLMISMPRFTFDEAAQEKLLEQAKAAGAKHILGSNIGHVTAAERFGMTLHADFGFNITNSVALNCLKKLGAADATASFELKASQVRTLKKAVPTGIFAYGYLPLMLTANCPVSQAVGCKNCTGKLIDRTNREFPVKCPKRLGLKSRDCVEIMNSEVLYLADRLDDFKTADFLMLSFFDETAEQVSEIIHDYTHRTDNSKPLTLTRGLYYRGVK